MDLAITLLVLVFGVCAVVARRRLDRLPPPPPSPQRRFQTSDVCYANSPYRTAQKKWKDHEDRNAAMIKAGAIYDPMRNGAPYYGGAVTMAYPNYQYSTCVASQIGNFQLVMPTPKPPSMPGPGPYGD